MKVRKAVIPAAGYGTRFLPATKSQPKEMLPIIDKPTIQYIVEEAVASGIEDILIITNSQKTSIENHFDRSWELEYFLIRKGKTEDLQQIQQISELANINTVRQKEQKGLGHAIYCARAFVGDEPFAVLLGDDIVDNDSNPAIKQLCDEYAKHQASIVGVQKVSYEDLNKYGIVDLEKPLENRLGRLIGMVEKPSPQTAPSHYGVLGRYVLSPKIFSLLEKQQAGHGGEIQLTDAIRELLKYEKVYALEFMGKRYDVGSKIGYLEAILDFAWKRADLKDDLRELLKRYK